MRLLLHRLESPIGGLLVAMDGQVLCGLDFHDQEQRLRHLLRRCVLTPTAAAPPCRAALEAYFSGEFASLDRILVRTEGTVFQQAVWAALRRIPPGTTTNYGALAAVIGRPTASRAVGAANGANPISIVIPCHRVIGAGGHLTGYGGGLPRKAWLLAHEVTGGAGSAPWQKPDCAP